MRGFACTVVLLVSCAVFAEANKDNDNWPCYLRKCSKKDPNLSHCLKENANHALQYILPGDAKAGFPNFLPFTAERLYLGANTTFNLRIDNAKISGLNHIHVNKMNWNFKTKTVDIKLNFNNAIVISGNYMSSGTLLKKPVRGKGYGEMVFVGGEYGGNKTFTMHYKLLKIRDKEYVQIKDSKCKTEEGFRTNMNNELISKNQASNDSDFINEHADEVDKMLHEGGLNDLMCAVVEGALNPVFNNFPLDLIFNSD